MMIWINLLCIAVIVVFVVDISGFPDTLKKLYWRWLFKDKPYKDFQFKLIDCSLCLTHHFCVLFALITGQFSLLVWMYICMLSMLAKCLKGLMVLVSDIIIKAENKIEDILL